MDGSDVPLWSIDQLKDYLRARKIAFSNVTKEDLQIRVLQAMRSNIQTTNDRQTVPDTVQDKLVLENGLITLPNPASLENWELGCYSVPAVSKQEVEHYFKQVNSDLGIYAKECEAIKLGKGLSMSNHVGGILYHGISPNIGYCFVKSTVVRQTCLREQPYTVWAILGKENAEIYGAYCNCIGGITGSCKHVAALLYSLLVIIQKGGNVACTSKAQTWHKSVKFHEPKFVKNIQIRKVKCNLEIDEFVKSSRRYGFDPRAPCDRDNSGDCKFDLASLAKLTNGKAAILKILSVEQPRQIQVESDDNVLNYESVESATLPSALPNLAAKLKQQHKSFDAFSDAFFQNMRITESQAQTVESVTSSQVDSVTWKLYREGRLTASKMKETLNKVNDQGGVSDKLQTSIRSAMGYTPEVKTESTEWGILNEDTACKSVFKYMKPRHKNLRMSRCGTYICAQHPYISGSPDRMLQCDCCGRQPLEVKNPVVGKKLPIRDYIQIKGRCIERHDLKIRLKRSHPYYYQVQTQMLVTNTNTCVFGLRTLHKDGLFIEVISKDDSVIAEILAKCPIFFKEVIIKEFFFENELIKVVMDTILKTVCTDIFKVKSGTKTNTLNRKRKAVGGLPCADPATVVNFDTCSVVTVDTSDTGYICDVCKQSCISDPVRFEDLSIECSTCKYWYHLKCVSLNGTESCVTNARTKWYCAKCSVET